MGFMWFLIGLIAGASLLGWVELARRVSIPWFGWAGLLLGEFLLLFCIAWSTASVAEGEPRAASMGLILFGAAGLIVLVMTWRFVVQGCVEAAQDRSG